MKFMKFLVALVSLAVVFGRIHKRRERGPNDGPNALMDRNLFIQKELERIFSEDQPSLEKLSALLNTDSYGPRFIKCPSPNQKLIDNIKNKMKENNYTYSKAYEAIVSEERLYKESCTIQNHSGKRKYFY
jgi:hypothetical protein